MGFRMSGWSEMTTTICTAAGFMAAKPSQTDIQGGIWEHNIILYYFGSRVQLVDIMFRATILHR